MQYVCVELPELTGHTAFKDKLLTVLAAMRKQGGAQRTGVLLLPGIRGTESPQSLALPVAVQKREEFAALGLTDFHGIDIPFFVARRTKRAGGLASRVWCAALTGLWAIWLFFSKAVGRPLVDSVLSTRVAGTKVGDTILSEALRQEYSVDSEGRVRLSFQFFRLFMKLCLASRNLHTLSIPKNSYFLAPDPTYSCEGVARIANHQAGTGRVIVTLSGLIISTPPGQSVELEHGLPLHMHLSSGENPSEKAGKGLERLRGRVDSGSWRDLSYVPYESSESVVPASFPPNGPETFWVGLWLHDFADAELLTGWTGFESHLQWSIEAIQTLMGANPLLRLAVKVHPTEIYRRRNSTSLTSGVDDLQHMFGDEPRITWILDPLSTRGLVNQLNPAFGVTLYGTIAEELAYLQVPVIASEKSLYGSYKIANYGASRESYLRLLQKASANPAVLERPDKDELTRYLDAKYGHQSETVSELRRRFEKRTPILSTGRDAQFWSWLQTVELNVFPLLTGPMQPRRCK